MTNHDIERLYRRYVERLYRFVLLRCRSVSDAQDITSDIFVRVVRAAPTVQYRSEAELRGWLFTIARHCIADYFRRSAAPAGLDDAARLPDPALLPPDLFDLQSAEAALLTAIHGLPDRMQEIVLLRYQVGLKNKEIAELLDIEPSSVSATLTKARDSLRSSFQSHL